MISLWTSQDISTATNGKASSFWECTGIAKDSRELTPGSAFIALKGPKTNGHDHLLKAFEAGASGAIVDQLPKDVPPEKCILVEDTFKALEALARAARQRSRAKVIAVTGSVGKTGTKENLAYVLGRQARTGFSERSFNNHWGVPYTLVNHDPESTYLVAEMGMNHRGELSSLTQIAKPHVALMTNITEMHLENLGSLEGIADAKAEIFEGMEAGGTAVLNRDIAMFERLSTKAQDRGLNVLTFGYDPRAAYRIMSVDALEGGAQRVSINALGKPLVFEIPTIALHWVMNAAAILATVQAVGGNVEQAAKDLSDLRIPEGRGEIHRVAHNGGVLTVIDESYNAGPTSMRAALSVLAKMTPGAGGRRLAVLGDMNELGERSKEEHQGLLEVLKAAHVDLVFTTGPKIKDLYDVLPISRRGGHSDDTAALVPILLSSVRENDIVLIKGSKGQYAHRGRMHIFVEALLELDELKGMRKVSA